MAFVELVGLTKQFGNLAVVNQVNLTIEKGSLVCLLGPSGCGKTTTLRLIAGFIEPSGGEIRVGGKRISVFYQNDAYGEAGRKGTELALERRKMKIHSQGTVERNTVAVQAAAKAIHASQPDAVVMVSAYTSIAAFVREMQKLGSGATFYNVSFVGSKALADALGKDGVGVAISQVVPFPWGTAVPVVKEYQQLAKKAGHADYNFSALEGFLCAKVMVEGLRRAGRNPTREGLVEALEKMDVDMGGFFVSYSPKNRAGSKFVDLTIISRDGKFLR